MNATSKKWTRPTRRVNNTPTLTLRENVEIVIRAFSGVLALAALFTVLIWIGLSF